MITLMDIMGEDNYKKWYNSQLAFEVEYEGEKVTYEDCKKLEDKFVENHPGVDIFCIDGISKYKTELIDDKYTVEDFYHMIGLGCEANPMVYFLRIAKKPIIGQKELVPFHFALNEGTYTQLNLFSKYEIGSLLCNPRQSCATNTLVQLAIYCNIFRGYKVDIIHRRRGDRYSFDVLYNEMYDAVPDFFKTKFKASDSCSHITCVIADDFEFLLGSEEKSKLSKYADNENILFFLSSIINDNLPEKYVKKIDSMDTLTDFSKINSIGYISSYRKSYSKSGCTFPVVRIKIDEHEILNDRDIGTQKYILDDPDVYRREIKRERIRKDNP